MLKRTPIIDCTDLYHPYQDQGDNFDLVAAYALPEIDLRAVILDVTERYRRGDGWNAEYPRRRDAGIVPVTQLNYLFNRGVPYAVSPHTAMRSASDTMPDLPEYEQAGIELLLHTLRESPGPVTILIFCSCRTVAVAFNREPALFREKVAALHLSAGTASPDTFDVDFGENRRIPLQPGSRGYLEWNVALDPHAFVCLLRSGLPLAVYPCAGEGGPFALDRHSSFYDLKSLRFIERMHPPLRNYLHYALARLCRNDFLLTLEDDPDPASLETVCGVNRHNVWETALWQMVTGRKLARRKDGTHRMLPASEVNPDDEVLSSELLPCDLRVADDGRFAFELTDGQTSSSIYHRADPVENERAMRDALPALYLGFLAERLLPAH